MPGLRTSDSSAIAASTRYSPSAALRRGIVRATTVNWLAPGRTMPSQSGLIWTEAPLLTRLATERSVYSKEGTAWTSCKMKKLWHPRVSVRMRGSLPTHVAGTRVPSAVMKALSDGEVLKRSAALLWMFSGDPVSTMSRKSAEMAAGTWSRGMALHAPGWRRAKARHWRSCERCGRKLVGARRVRDRGTFCGCTCLGCAGARMPCGDVGISLGKLSFGGNTGGAALGRSPSMRRTWGAPRGEMGKTFLGRVAAGGDRQACRVRGGP